MMDDAELTTAAATGAAAAVAAVQDDQAEAERQAAMESSTIVATAEAQEAAERAEAAEAVSTAAVEASMEATQQAELAAAVATEAVERTNEATDALAAIREELNQRDERLLAALEERFGPRQVSDQPREVVVTSEQPNTGQGDNSGSSGGNGPGADRPPYRHRFGRRS